MKYDQFIKGMVYLEKHEGCSVQIFTDVYCGFCDETHNKNNPPCEEFLAELNTMYEESKK